MRPPLVLWLALSLLPGTGMAQAGVCKWIDRDGVVHYAEACPEGVEGTVVRTDPPPSQRELDAAAKRSQALLEQRQHRSEQIRQAQEQELDTRREQQHREAGLAQECEAAFAERNRLSAELPVYRDQQGQLHHVQSLHDYWYRDERRYLEDQERAEALAQVELRIETTCEGLRPSKFTYVYRYPDPPRLSTVLELLDKMQSPFAPTQDEVCSFARQVLSDLESARQGLLSDEQRQLKPLVNARCN